MFPLQNKEFLKKLIFKFLNLWEKVIKYNGLCSEEKLYLLQTRGLNWLVK